MGTEGLPLRVLQLLLLAALLAAGCSGQRGALQSPRSPFTRMDADADGYLAAAELDPALARALERWDDDKDGRISYPEFNRYRGHALP